MCFTVLHMHTALHYHNRCAASCGGASCVRFTIVNSGAGPVTINGNSKTLVGFASPSGNSYDTNPTVYITTLNGGCTLCFPRVLLTPGSRCCARCVLVCVVCVRAAITASGSTNDVATVVYDGAVWRVLHAVGSWA